MKVIMIFVMTSTPVFANSVSTSVIDTINPTGDASKMAGFAGKILGFLRNVALIGGVIIIAILGVKYMMGSLEEKADYKKSMIPLIVGIIVVMGATTIAKFLFDTFTI